MAALRWRAAQIALQLESVEGTAATLIAADANIKAEDVTLKSEFGFASRAKAVSASLSKHAGVPTGMRLWRLNFRVMLSGSGTPATPPSWGKAMRACGCKETIVAVTSVEYNPGTTVTAGGDGSSATIGVYVDGKRYLLNGARGNVKQTANGVDAQYYEFEFLGGYNEPTTTALISAVAYETAQPAALLGTGTFSLDGNATLKYKSFSIDFGNQLVPRRDPNKANGFFSTVIASRDIKGQIVLEEELVATYNFWSKHTTANQGILSLVQGTVSGKILTTSAQKVQYAGVDLTDEEGLAMCGLALEFNENADAGDDEYSMKQT